MEIVRYKFFEFEYVERGIARMVRAEQNVVRTHVSLSSPEGTSALRFPQGKDPCGIPQGHGFFCL